MKSCRKTRQETMVLWVFGYGSLVWNPGFDFDEKIIGFIKDYRRVFDLGELLLAYVVQLTFLKKILPPVARLMEGLISLSFQHA